MAKASDNEFPSILLAEQASAPATPGTDLVRAYRKADGIYYVDDAGTEHGPIIESIVAGTNVTVDVTDPANPVVASSASGGGGSDLLGIAEATASATYSTTSGTDADMDATNLSITFTVPASEAVLVEQIATRDGVTAEWSVREGTTTLKARSLGGTFTTIHAVHLITGLTASAELTYKWGHRRVSGSGTASTYTGGAGGVAGNALMLIRDAATS